MSLRQSEHRISTLRVNESQERGVTVNSDDGSRDTTEAAAAVTSEIVSENCRGHAFNAFNDSSRSAKSPTAGQKSVSLSDRNLSSEASSVRGGSPTVIKNYLRRLAAEETSILGQIVR